MKLLVDVGQATDVGADGAHGIDVASDATLSDLGCCRVGPLPDGPYEYLAPPSCEAHCGEPVETTLHVEEGRSAGTLHLECGP